MNDTEATTLLRALAPTGGLVSDFDPVKRRRYVRALFSYLTAEKGYIPAWLRNEVSSADADMEKAIREGKVRCYILLKASQLGLWGGSGAEFNPESAVRSRAVKPRSSGQQSLSMGTALGTTIGTTIVHGYDRVVHGHTVHVEGHEREVERAIPVAPPVEVKESAKTKEYRYAAQNRPIGYANVPKGHLRADSSSHPVARHGIAVYDHPLTDEEVSGYELVPVVSRDEMIEEGTRKIQKYQDKYLEYWNRGDKGPVRSALGSVMDKKIAEEIPDRDAFADAVMERIAQKRKPEEVKPEPSRDYTDMKPTTGMKVHGYYMGAPYTGTVQKVESDSSGYPGTQNDRRLWINVDNELIAFSDAAIPGRKIRDAGESIILNGDKLETGHIRFHNDFSNTVESADKPRVGRPQFVTDYNTKKRQHSLGWGGKIISWHPTHETAFAAGLDMMANHRKA